MKFHIPLLDSAKKLREDQSEFITLFEHGSLSVELYEPDTIDRQKPHDRDELYVIASGAGEFLLEHEKTTFKTGDVLHVPAGKEHRFINFSEDFKTWVVFYGPTGGELPSHG